MGTFRQYAASRASTSLSVRISLASVITLSPAPVLPCAHPAFKMSGVLIGANEKFARLGCGDHLERTVRHALRKRRIKRHQLGVDLHGVGVHRRENRWVFMQLEIGLVKHHLSVIDRLGDGQLVFFEVTPRLGTEALVLPQSGVLEAIGTADDHAIDVSSQSTVQRSKAKLLTISLRRSQIKTCVAKPLDHAVFR